MRVYTLESTREEGVCHHSLLEGEKVIGDGDSLGINRDPALAIFNCYAVLAEFQLARTPSLRSIETKLEYEED